MALSSRVTRSAAVALTIVLLLIAPALAPVTRAQPLTPDASTLWLGHFDGTPDDARPDSALTATSLAWTAGRIGQGLLVTSPALLSYPRNGNLDGTTGTIECWVRPNWNGNDGLSHTIVECGGGGGILVVKDGASNLRIIINRFGANGHPEMGAAWNVGSWTAGAWHHCTFTWSPTLIRVYTEGSLRASQVPAFAPPALTQGDLNVAGQGGSERLEGTLDELRISNMVRSATEIAAAAGGATLTHDGNTLFLAHYDGSPTGTPDGPNVATGLHYATGLHGSALVADATTDLRIGTARHLNGPAGTIECWVRPAWNGGDGLGHVLLECGLGGGLLVLKDGGNYWRIILNRWAVNGQPEIGVSVNVSALWTAGVWHHCAFTWASDSLRCYLDGERVNAVASAITPPALTATEFRIGREAGGNALLSDVDELRISQVVRSPEEIRAAYLAGLPLTAITVQPDTLRLLAGGFGVPVVRAVAQGDSVTLPPGTADWESDNPAVAVPGVADTLWAGAAGVATATATFRSFSAPVQVLVTVPRLLVAPDTVYAWVSRAIVPTLRYVSGPDTLTVPAGAATWETSDSGIVAAGSGDTLRAVGPGTATLMARYLGAADSLTMIVEVGTLLIAPDAAHLWVSWSMVPALRIAAGPDTGIVPVGAAAWESSDEWVVTAGAADTVWAVGDGEATLTATYAGATANLAVFVRAPVLGLQHEELPEDLTTPAADAIWDVPVLIIRYLPTADGDNLDTSIAPDFWETGEISLADLDANILAMNRRVKFALEEGSRFRAYGDPAARHALGYHVVDQVTLFEQTPPGRIIGFDQGDPVWAPDWFAMFRRLDVRHYVEDLGVKEIWVWAPGLGHFPSFNPEVHQLRDFRGGWESNMSSPVTGDISNSNRDATDLPVYSKSYVVYDYNFRRSQAEAVHDHGHQLEAQLAHVDQVDNGFADLFWSKFCGRDEAGQRILGRCGDTHCPPNTLTEYDYENMDSQWSDIADWEPYGSGVPAWINAGTWGSIEYPWPDGVTDFGQRVETQWYIYWMQSMPGDGNTIPYDADWLTNWWEFVGDWDGAMTAGHGLQSSEPVAGVAPGGVRRPALTFSVPAPNPSSGGATFSLVLGTAGSLRVEIFDVQGRRVRTLRDGPAPTGGQRVAWDGRDGRGVRVAPGLYFARAQAMERQIVRRVCLIP